MATLGICNACLLFCCSCCRHLCIQPLPAAALHLQLLHPGWQPQGRAASLALELRGVLGDAQSAPPSEQGLGGLRAPEFAFALLMIQTPHLLQQTQGPELGMRLGAQDVPAALEQQEAGPNLAGTECDNSLPHRRMFYFYPKAFC